MMAKAAFCRFTLAALLILLNPSATNASEFKRPFLPEKVAESKLRESGSDNPGALIVGGEDAPRGRYRYMVSLLKSDAYPEMLNYCSGTLIAPTVVLSMAGCPDPTEVTIGRYDIGSSGDSLGEYEQLTVADVARHPNFNSSTFTYNIMLIKLSQPSNMPTVKIDIFGSTMDTLIALGWGVLSAGGDRPDILQQVTLKYITNKRCNKMFYDAFGFKPVTTDHMCAAAPPGKGPCFGDSGGPLIISGGSEAQDIQVGVLSWIQKDCNTYPAGYSRVAESWDDFLKPTLDSWGVDITCPSPSPSPSPDPCYPCADDPDYLFKGRGGKDCAWVANKAAKLCKKADNVIGCPYTCGVCDSLSRRYQP